MTLTYLASPYSHESELIRKGRVEATRRFVAHMMRIHQMPLISPILYCHSLNEYVGFDPGAEAWLFFNAPLMQACNSCAVLKLEGWQTSEGVAWEIEYFNSTGKPIKFYDPVEVPAWQQ